MTQCSFIHVADVHLDSPLAHLRRLDATTAERLQSASRRSLQNVVQLAIEHQVAAVVIAGDLFDGPVKDVGAGLWVDGLFKRLTREGIAVILIRGNHDSLSNARRVIRWSDGVHELPPEKPTSVPLEQHGLVFHGQSFGARSETADLAANYPAPRSGYFNVGLLHTSLAGSAQHDTYAPTSVATLESKGYDYWALGHIHVRSLESHSPHCYIGFSGNTQGRHIREPGAKGCHLVQVVDGQLASVQFIPTDSLRWYELSIGIDDLDHLGDIEGLVETEALQLRDAADGRALAVRVRLQGASKLHADLTRAGTIDKLAEVVGARLADLGEIWLEAIRVSSRPARASVSADLDLPLKYIAQVAGELREEGPDREALSVALEELLRRSRAELAEVGWPLVNDQTQASELNRLLAMAEDLLVARLVADEG
jgi:DNA repair protein SbcD/Mre11